LDNRKRLFVASCAALVATAMAFSLRTDIMGDLGREFRLTGAQVGWAAGAGIWGFTVSIFIWGALIDFLGMGKALWMAFFGHLIGVTLIVFFAQSFPLLFLGWLCIGLANGMVEAAINPLAATIYAENKTHMLNVLHAWWPGGLIIGGLLGFFLTKILGLDQENVSANMLALGWRIKVCLVYLPALIYGALILGQKFPKTERVASGVSTKDMFKEALRPLFLLILFCMLLTASTELGPDQWVGVLVQDLVGIRGVLLLVYTAGLMFVLRFFAGPLVHRLSPIGLLMCSAVLSCAGLYWVSSSKTILTIFLAATIFGVGKTYFWPTMLGMTSERFPKGGALLMGLMGGSGMLIVGIATVPMMGYIQDTYRASAFRTEAGEPIVNHIRSLQVPAAAFAKEVGDDLVAQIRKDAEKLGQEQRHVRSAVEQSVQSMKQAVEKYPAAVTPEMKARITALTAEFDKEKGAPAKSIFTMAREVVGQFDAKDQPKVKAALEKAEAAVTAALARAPDAPVPDDLKKASAEAAGTPILVALDEVGDQLPPAEQKKAWDAAPRAREDGAVATFRYVAILPIIVLLIFIGLLVYDLKGGGYKKVTLAAPPAAPEQPPAPTPPTT